MEVKIRLEQIAEELVRLKKQRDKEAHTALGYLKENRTEHFEASLGMWEYYNELIDYYSKIEVTFEDKYNGFFITDEVKEMEK